MMGFQIIDSPDTEFLSETPSFSGNAPIVSSEREAKMAFEVKHE